MTKLKPGGLGRGLDALINPNFKEDINEPVSISQTELKDDDGKSVDILAKIDIDKIVPNPFQPRVEFDAEALNELKNSILTNGLIQPVTVRRKNGIYELISGERRFRACREIGYKNIPAYVIQVDTDEAMLALSLIENIQREKLNPIEIAEAYKRLIEECKLSQEEVAIKVGKDRTTITNTLRLLKLPEKIKKYLIEGTVTQGHARALINLENENLQIEIADKIIKELLSVRKVEQIVKDIITGKKQKRKSNTDKNSNTTVNLPLTNIENRLRGVMGTKVSLKQKKDGTGDIKIEFYSRDELERLIELFDIIEKYGD
ncbi:MAG: ParB/RepB/Spo0J family partition protein [Melioribacteraceae bacterium]|nr:ParB/RepB/Spo0J family partition protein [Melioribacteraceae bacterium]